MSLLNYQTVPQGESNRQVQVRVPLDIYEELRRLAFERRTTRQQIVLDALRAKLQDEKGPGK